MRPLPARRACLSSDAQVTRDGSSEIVSTDVRVPAGWDVLRTTVRDAQGLLEIIVPSSQASAQRAAQQHSTGSRSSMDLHDARRRSHDYNHPAKNTHHGYHAHKPGNDYSMPRPSVPQYGHHAGSTLQDTQTRTNIPSRPRQHVAKNGHHASDFQDSHLHAGSRLNPGHHNALRHRGTKHDGAGGISQDPRFGIGDRDIQETRFTQNGKRVRDYGASVQHSSQDLSGGIPVIGESELEKKDGTDDRWDHLKRVYETNGQGAAPTWQDAGHHRSVRKIAREIREIRAPNLRGPSQGNRVILQTQEASLVEQLSSLIDLHGSEGIEVVEEEYPEPVKRSDAAEGYWDNRGEFQQY